MSTKTGIEWTDAKLAANACATFGKALNQKLCRFDPFSRHPLPNVTVAVGAIAAHTRRDDVFGRSLAASRDWNNVIPGFGCSGAISAPALEILQQTHPADFRNALHTALSPYRMCTARIPKRGGTTIKRPRFGICVRSTHALVHVESRKPIAARSAPRQPCSTARPSLSNRWPRHHSAAFAIRANVVKAALSRSVSSERSRLLEQSAFATTAFCGFKEVDHG